MPMDNIFLDRARNKRLLINVVCLAVSLVAVSTLLQGVGNFDGFSASKMNWAMVITMLLSSLCGPLTASLMELILFMYMAFINWDINATFGLFVVLTSALLAVLPIKKGWYKSWWKSLLTIPFFSMFIDMSFSLVGVAYGMGERSEDDLAYRLDLEFSSLFYICIVVGVCYLFFNYAPKKIRPLFYGWDLLMSGKYVRGFGRKRFRPGVKNKVTFFIVAEAMLLCFAAMVFAFIMFNKNANRLTRGSPLSDLFITYALIQTNFAMLLSLLNFSVPIILITRSFAVTQIANPIRMMATGMKSFTRSTIGGAKLEGEDTDIAGLDIRTGDEIQDLYEELKSTAAQLSDYIDSLQREQDLKEAVRVEKAANQAKTSFLSSMSHEIRTPINAVLGLDEMILRESDEEHIIRYAA
ncbi:MAG: hypothetical protein ILP18_05555, partial [Treponema sp.]|nr:hypothetical protein [Treponema sp.]